MHDTVVAVGIASSAIVGVAVSTVGIIASAVGIGRLDSNRLATNGSTLAVAITVARSVGEAIATSKVTRSEASTSAREVGGIKWRTGEGTALTWVSPVSLAGEGHRVEARELGLSSRVGEWDVADKRDVVEAEVPDGGVDHAVSREGEDGTDDSASKDVVPVVELVDGKSTANEDSTEDGHVGDDELPHSRVVVGPDLQLSVKVEVEEDKAGEAGGCVTGWERLKRVVDLALITCADIALVHYLSETTAVLFTVQRDGRFADGQEVRTETTDEPLEEDLEDSGRDETVEKTHDGVVHIPEASDADLHEEEDEDGDKGSKHGC